MSDALLTIWYDASCPLCETELRTLQRHAGEGRIRLVDCSPADFDDDEPAAAGVTRGQMMRCIHARDGEGHWLRGVNVFERAYRLAGVDGVADLFAHRRLRPLWDRLYPWVARHRTLLSRLRLDALYAAAIDRAARRSARRAQACASRDCGFDTRRY